MTTPFEKWQGLGNHFIVLETLPENCTVAQLCDPRLGVGADGVLVMQSDPPRMTIFNADGSRAAMCGNGLRCAARWLTARGVDLSGGIATDSGTLKVRRVDEGVTVEVGIPTLVGTGTYAGHAFCHVDVGNPHAVFLDPSAAFDLESVGEAMQDHSDFPDGVNVHEVRVAQSFLIVIPYERGVGLTQACGTGAAASAFAVHQTRQTPWPMDTELPGGRLTFELGEDGLLWMTGPAACVFSGRWP